MSEVVATSRAYTPPTVIEPITQISTQTEETTEPTLQQKVIVEDNEISPPQPTEKEKTDTAPTPTTQTATNPTTPPAPISAEPKNGDTRIINDQRQGYLLGFGWVDYMGENECTFEEGIYESGNKVGIMN